MTENQWDSLKDGDQIVNKRSPGIPLVIVKRLEGSALRVKAPHGEFVVNDHTQFVVAFPQEKMPL